MSQATMVTRPDDSAAHPHRPSLIGVGTIIWLGSEFMFFSSLFAAYFTLRAHASTTWPPPPVKLDVLQSGIATIILVLSSFTCQIALFRLEKGNRSSTRRWLVLTIIMGAIFLANQAYEWATLNFSTSSNAFGSMFYLMTGLHGLHVTLGLVAMLGLLGRMAGPKGDPGEVQVFQGISYYWHFVDIVWVGLYSALFLLH